MRTFANILKVMFLGDWLALEVEVDVVRADVDGVTTIPEPVPLASALVVWGDADVVVLAFEAEGDDVGVAPALAVV